MILCELLLENQVIQKEYIFKNHLEVSHLNSDLNILLNLYKGVNKIVIEWPENSTKIIVYCKN